jgi:hypothetical protein
MHFKICMLLPVLKSNTMSGDGILNPEFRMYYSIVYSQVLQILNFAPENGQWRIEEILLAQNLAERVRFELTRRFWRLLDFESSAFGHSATSPLWIAWRKISSNWAGKARCLIWPEKERDELLAHPANFKLQTFFIGLGATSSGQARRGYRRTFSSRHCANPCRMPWPRIDLLLR